MSTVASAARAIVDGMDPQVRAGVAADPRRALEAHYGMEVRESTSFAARGDRGWCDGVSFESAKVVLYRATHSNRDQFTLAHEIAHLEFWNASDDCIDWIGDQEPVVLEQLCDAVASRLLISDEVLDDVLDGRAPEAAHLADLRTRTRASRSVCLIALCRRMPCLGFGLISELGSDRVFQGTRVGDTRPYPWKDDSLPAAHPLRSDEPPRLSKSWWPSASGERSDFYQSVFDDGQWRYAVFAVNDIWNVTELHFDSALPEDRGNDALIRCRCGYKGTTRWWPCKECDQPQCPDCGECACAQRDRADPWSPCASCGNQVRAHNLDADGWCVDCCRDYGK